MYYGLSGDNTGSHSFNFTIIFRLDGSFTVNGLSQCIDNTSDHGIPDRDFHHASGCLYNITFADIVLAAQKYGTYVVLFKVKHHAVYLAGEFKQFTLHGIFQSMHTGNTICYLNDRSHFRYFHIGSVSFNLILDYGTYLFWFQIHRSVRTFLNFLTAA